MSTKTDKELVQEIKDGLSAKFDAAVQQQGRLDYAQMISEALKNVAEYSDAGLSATKSERTILEAFSAAVAGQVTLSQLIDFSETLRNISVYRKLNSKV